MRQEMIWVVGMQDTHGCLLTKTECGFDHYTRAKEVVDAYHKVGRTYMKMWQVTLLTSEESSSLARDIEKFPCDKS